MRADRIEDRGLERGARLRIELSDEAVEREQPVELGVLRLRADDDRRRRGRLEPARGDRGRIARSVAAARLLAVRHLDRPAHLDARAARQLADNALAVAEIDRGGGARVGEVVPEVLSSGDGLQATVHGLAPPAE